MFADMPKLEPMPFLTLKQPNISSKPFPSPKRICKQEHVKQEVKPESVKLEVKQESVKQEAKHEDVKQETASKKENQETAPSYLSHLSPDQCRILDWVIAGENVFFTGAGGTGKSFLLNAIKERLVGQSNTYVTALTGIAATNIGGTTLHSFAGIGIGDADDFYRYVCTKNQKARLRWLHAKILLVDEISMLSAELFERLERLACLIRQNNSFFGGIQIIFLGDFLQLPPIGKNKKTNPRKAFESEIWQKAHFKQLNLTTPFRQKGNDTMVEALNNIRYGNITESVKQFIASVQRPIVYQDGILPTKLYARNVNVDAENNIQLEKLQGESRVYTAKCDGVLQDIEDMRRNCLAPDTLQLKVNAQVMYLINNPEHALVNGSRGVVVGFTSGRNLPVVQFSNGKPPFVVQEHVWEKRVAGRICATKTQIPLKLAWAISIHKSQGMSISRCQISLKECFEVGQAYVALSRATNQDGLEITSYDATCIVADPKVIQYYDTFQNSE